MGLLDDLLTEQEAAGKLCITPEALAQQRRRGTGPPYGKIGRRVLYREEALVDWLEKPAREAAAREAAEVEAKRLLAEIAREQKTREVMEAEAALESVREAFQWTRMDGYVYVFQMELAGPVKIGFSTCPDKRRYALQNSSPWTLKDCGKVKATEAAELRLHAYLRLLVGLNMRGEWYRPYAALVDALDLAGLKARINVSDEVVRDDL